MKKSWDHHRYRHLIAEHLLNSIRDLKIEGGSSYPDSKVAARRTNFELDLRHRELEKEGSLRTALIITKAAGDSRGDFLRLK